MNKKILYITPLWTGFEELLFKGVDDPKGMPAFIKPLKQIIENGDSVDIILIHSFRKLPPFEIKADWAKKINFIMMIYWPKNKILMFLAGLSLQRKLRTFLKQTKKYNFAYCHGSASSVASSVLKEANIAFGHRLYGTFFYANIEKYGFALTKFMRFYEYKAFFAPKKFLLVTDDGSKGDMVYKSLNVPLKNFDFYFWKNGVDENHKISEPKLYDRTKQSLVYVARVSRWKRQDRAINILKMLSDANIDMNLYIAGQISEKDYYEELKQQISDLRLEKNVFFLGPISREEANFLYKYSIASFSLYDMCNLGNVFYEMLTAGAKVIVANDGSTDDFIIDKQNGFLVTNDKEATQVILQLINEQDLGDYISSNAKDTAITMLCSWKRRVNKEVSLIYNSCL